MVVRILNIELDYLTVDFASDFSHMCCMLATGNVMCWLHFLGAILLICMCRKGGRLGGQEQELFSPVLFIQILRERIVLY